MDEKRDTPPESKQEESVIQQQPAASNLPASEQPPPYPANPQPISVGDEQPTPMTKEEQSATTIPYPQPGVPYPQPGVPGQGPPPPPGYHPQTGQPGYPAPGNPYFSAAAGGALAQNLPPREVIWMPPPSDAPPGCPPGLEYLTQVDQILVHQQIEILELITNFETENKYRIRNTLGQQIYFALEQSSIFQRQCCGPGRAFAMSITDNSQKEVIHLERPLRYYCNCSGLTCYCCLSCCLPHIIEVQAPPGTVVGYVKQEPLGITHPWFSIQNADGETILRIKGPVLGCSCYADAHFDVLSSDSTQEVGKITKQWSGLAKEYFTDADNFGIKFPMDLDVKMKAVMLGACFLIDFMFFEAPGGNQNQRRHR